MNGWRHWPVAVLCLGGAGLVLGSGVLTHATWQSGAACLTYPRATPRYEFSQSPFGWFGRRGAPKFFVPAAIPTIDILDDAAATGLLVSYLPYRDGGFRTSRPQTCAAEETDHGLLRFPPRAEGAAITLGCASGYRSTTYVPVPSDPLADQVRISCSPGPDVVGCRMDDRMPNGWQATISLPKTHLADWRAASDAARAFFATTLVDCGEPGAAQRG